MFWSKHGQGKWPSQSEGLGQDGLWLGKSSEWPASSVQRCAEPPGGSPELPPPPAAGLAVSTQGTEALELSWGHRSVQEPRTAPCLGCPICPACLGSLLFVLWWVTSDECAGRAKSSGLTGCSPRPRAGLSRFALPGMKKSMADTAPAGARTPPLPAASAAVTHPPPCSRPSRHPRSTSRS